MTSIKIPLAKETQFTVKGGAYLTEDDVKAMVIADTNPDPETLPPPQDFPPDIMARFPRLQECLNYFRGKVDRKEMGWNTVIAKLYYPDLKHCDYQDLLPLMYWGEGSPAPVRNGSWVNDNVIDYFGGLLEAAIGAWSNVLDFSNETGLRNRAPVIRILGTIYERAANQGNVAPEARFSPVIANCRFYDRVIVPCNRDNNHWFLLVWEKENPDRFLFYDSLALPSPGMYADYLDRLFEWVRFKRGDARNNASESEIVVVTAGDAYRQDGAFECGVYTMAYMYNAALKGLNVELPTPASFQRWKATIFDCILSGTPHPLPPVAQPTPVVAQVEPAKPAPAPVVDADSDFEFEPAPKTKPVVTPAASKEVDIWFTEPRPNEEVEFEFPVELPPERRARLEKKLKELEDRHRQLLHRSILQAYKHGIDDYKWKRQEEEILNLLKKIKNTKAKLAGLS